MGLTLREVANVIGGEVVGDDAVMIERVAPIDLAGEGDITFLSNQKYIAFLRSTKASAIIVEPRFRQANRTLVLMANPYLGFARAVELLMRKPLPRQAGVHPTATVAEGVRIGENVSIGPRVIVEEGAEIGNGVTLMAGVYVGHGVVIGENTLVYPNVTLYHGTRIGKRCVIHANVVMGSDGFGWAPEGTSFVPIPQVGITDIADDVSIGAGSIINRGGLGNTSVGRGTKIDSLVIISHNVEVGEDCLFVSQVGISGSVKIGNHVTLGGQVGVAGHLKIGDNVQVAAQSGVSNNLDANGQYFGSPARPIHQTKRTLAALNKLPELRDEIRHVQRRMRQITELLDRDVRESKLPEEKK
jgi:UDP-3-O-[3-hydroxymyristoyl] glucosamine N-acyltransferase